MKSRPIGPDQTILSSHHNDRRDDARGGSFLLPHQQLGALALGTAPTNGQTVSFIINGTTIAANAVASVSSPNDILNPGTAAGFVANLINWLRRPDLTNSNQVAASSANQTLLQYVGWGYPGASTNIVPFSLNKNVNGNTDILTSFNVTTTVTSGTWTAQTMQLYVEEGTYFIGSTRVLFTGGSTPTVTAPSSHPRIDVLSVDSSGTLAWTVGTESSSPVAPTYPVGKLVICELYNVVGETALYDNENQQAGQGYIYNDVRPILGGTYISSTSQIASGIVLFDPGSDAQGDIYYWNGSALARLPAGTSGAFLQTQGVGANPQWASGIPKSSASGTKSGNYTTTSTSFVDVDATHLSLTLTGLTLGQPIMFSAGANVKNTNGSETITVQLTDETNSNAALGSGTFNQNVYGFISFSGTYVVPSTSLTIRMQWKSGVSTPGLTMENDGASFKQYPFFFLIQ